MKVFFKVEVGDVLARQVTGLLSSFTKLYCIACLLTDNTRMIPSSQPRATKPEAGRYYTVNAGLYSFIQKSLMKKSYGDPGRIQDAFVMLVDELFGLQIIRSIILVLQIQHLFNKIKYNVCKICLKQYIQYMQNNKNNANLHPPQSSNNLNQLDQPFQFDITNISNNRQCRICWEQQGNLIQLPCACIGQIGLIHEQCFTKWVNSTRNQNHLRRNLDLKLTHISQDIYQIPCEICKAKVRLQMKEQKKCFKLEQIKKPQKYASIVCIFVLLAIVGFGLFIAISMLVNPDGNVIRKIISVILIVVLVLITACLVYRQVQKMMIRNITKLKIISNQPQQFNRQNRNIQIGWQPNDERVPSYDNFNRPNGNPYRFPSNNNQQVQRNYPDIYN